MWCAVRTADIGVALTRQTRSSPQSLPVTEAPNSPARPVAGSGVMASGRKTWLTSSRQAASWTGLGRFCVAAVDELGLDRFHLVVHDIGGPVGFELATAMPTRIASLTLLNTTIDVAGFRPPWTMEPFRHRGIGELWMASLTAPAFRFLMRLQGIGDPAAVSRAELDTYLALIKGPDHGRAFLQIMRSTERTVAKQARYRAAVRNVPYPVQALWAADDPAMTLAGYGEKARAAAGLARLHTVPGKHFPQEDQAPAIASQIAEFVLFQ
jgi:haloalkane dehalogenase